MANTYAKIYVRVSLVFDMPPLRGWSSVCPFLLQTWRSYAEPRAWDGVVPSDQPKLRSSAMFVEKSCAGQTSSVGAA
jgi:hypothetical protein